MNRFFLYVEAAGRKGFAARRVTVTDLTASISMAIGGKGLQDYLDKLRMDYDGR